jgi:hypothetical protein
LLFALLTGNKGSRGDEGRREEGGLGEGERASVTMSNRKWNSCTTGKDSIMGLDPNLYTSPYHLFPVLRFFFYTLPNFFEI